MTGAPSGAVFTIASPPPETLLFHPPSGITVIGEADPPINGTLSPSPSGVIITGEVSDPPNIGGSPEASHAPTVQKEAILDTLLYSVSALDSVMFLWPSLA